MTSRTKLSYLHIALVCSGKYIVFCTGGTCRFGRSQVPNALILGAIESGGPLYSIHRPSKLASHADQNGRVILHVIHHTLYMFAGGMGLIGYPWGVASPNTVYTDVPLIRGATDLAAAVCFARLV